MCKLSYCLLYSVIVSAVCMVIRISDSKELTHYENEDSREKMLAVC